MLTLANLLISKSISPTFVPGWLVFITAQVSAQVYITKPTADPAAKTVFDQSTFSTVNGEMPGGEEQTNLKSPKVLVYCTDKTSRSLLANVDRYPLTRIELGNILWRYVTISIKNKTGTFGDNI